MIPEETEYLFSYGTLQQESVQLATFGRKLGGNPDTLLGYRLMMIEVKDREFVLASGSSHHRNLQLTGVISDTVSGTVFTLTKKELQQADEYEPEGYKRVLAQLGSGISAWIYLNTPQ